MDTTEETPVRIYYLFAQYLVDAITPGEGDELLRALDRNPVLREELRDNVLADFVLHERYDLLRQMETDATSHVSRAKDPLWDAVIAETRQSAAQEARSPVPLHVPLPSRKKMSSLNRTFQSLSRGLLRIPLWTRYISLLVFFVLTVTVVSLLFFGRSGPGPVPAPIATLSASVNATWKPDTSPVKWGQQLQARSLSLISGQVRLDFRSGAILLVEGPTDLVIDDELNTFCERGRVSVTVPPSAKGFRVKTPHGEFIDYGTRFAIGVTNRGSRLDVIEGRVGVKTEAAGREIVDRGGGMEVGEQQIPVRVKMNPKRYLTTDVFEEKQIRFETKEREKKESELKGLAQDPDLLAGFSLSPNENKTFRNLAESGRNTCSDAVSNNGISVPGQLRGESVMGFRKNNDSVWVKTDTSLSSLTLVATVRIQSLKPDGNILFSNEQFLSLPGTIQWQIQRDGRILLHITPADKEVSPGYSTPVILTRDDKKVWLTLAVVVDPERQEIRHYIDGHPVARIPWKKVIPIRMTNFNVGNGFNINGRNRNAWFDGDVSRFLLFRSALSDEKIKSLNESM